MIHVWTRKCLEALTMRMKTAVADSYRPQTLPLVILRERSGFWQLDDLVDDISPVMYSNRYQSGVCEDERGILT